MDLLKQIFRIVSIIFSLFLFYAYGVFVYAFYEIFSKSKLLIGTLGTSSIFEILILFFPLGAVLLKIPEMITCAMKNKQSDNAESEFDKKFINLNFGKTILNPAIQILTLFFLGKFSKLVFPIELMLIGFLFLVAFDLIVVYLFLGLFKFFLIWLLPYIIPSK